MRGGEGQAEGRKAKPWQQGLSKEGQVAPRSSPDGLEEGGIQES